MQNPLVLRVSMVVDAHDEAAARAIGRGFVAATGLEGQEMGWEPYHKLGPHSRVWLALWLPPEVGQDVGVAAVDAVCASAVDPEIVAGQAYRNLHDNEDGSLFYNRIFDVRRDLFTLPDILWLDVELETNAEAQAELRRTLGR